MPIKFEQDVQALLTILRFGPNPPVASTVALFITGFSWTGVTASSTLKTWSPVHRTADFGLGFLLLRLPGLGFCLFSVRLSFGLTSFCLKPPVAFTEAFLVTVFSWTVVAAGPTLEARCSVLWCTDFGLCPRPLIHRFTCCFFLGFCLCLLFGCILFKLWLPLLEVVKVFMRYWLFLEILGWSLGWLTFLRIKPPVASTVAFFSTGFPWTTLAAGSTLKAWACVYWTADFGLGLGLDLFNFLDPSLVFGVTLLRLLPPVAGTETFFITSSSRTLITASPTLKAWPPVHRWADFGFCFCLGLALSLGPFKGPLLKHESIVHTINELALAFSWCLIFTWWFSCILFWQWLPLLEVLEVWMCNMVTFWIWRSTGIRNINVLVLGCFCFCKKSLSSLRLNYKSSWIKRCLKTISTVIEIFEHW